MLDKQQILNALSQVQEPDLGKDLVSLKMVENLQIDGYKVSFTIALTTLACPMKDHMRRACVNAIHLLVHKDADVSVHFRGPHKTAPTSKDALLPGVKNIIAVFSGKGGVGKSTVAANLAVGLAKEGQCTVGLVDADIYGPSIPIMFNVQGQRPRIRQVDGKQKIVPLESHHIRLISIGSLVDEKQAIIWRGPMASNAIRQFITDVDWGKLDYLVIDMPPGTGDIHLTLINLLPISGALIVSTPQKVALADAKKAIMMFAQANSPTPILGIIENMAYFTPAELPQNKYYIFGRSGGEQLAEQFELPLLGSIPLVQSIRERADEGTPQILHPDCASTAIFTQIMERTVRALSMYQAGMSRAQIRSSLSAPL